MSAKKSGCPETGPDPEFVFSRLARVPAPPATPAATPARARVSRRLARHTASFARDERGSLIIFSLFMLLIMVVIGGMAVDLMRAETQRSRMQSTLDRAVLAAASLDQTLNSQNVVHDYFNKAGLGSTLKSVTVTRTLTSKTVSASAVADINTFFLKFPGINKLSAPSAGEAEESIDDLEVSLVLDVSGSMNQSAQSGGSKIDVLKTAAKEFVYLMQCDPDAVPPYNGNCVVQPNTVSISMIPYNHQVIAGEALLQQFDTTEEHTNSSCIDLGGSDYNSVPLALDPQVINASNPPSTNPSIKRSTQLDFWSGYGGYSGRNARDHARECPPNVAPYNRRTIIPYADDYTALQTAIDGLYAGGNTSIDLAAKWGAALLDPAFRPGLTNMVNSGLIDANFAGRPYDYTKPRNTKVMVLMTDGINTSRIWVKNQFRSGPSPFYVVKSNHSAIPPGGWNAQQDHISVYNAARDNAGYRPYRRLDHGDWSWTPDGGNNATRLDWADVWERYHVMTVANALNSAGINNGNRWWKLASYDYTSIKNQRLNNLCTAAKNQGIVIFTIGFETTTASNQVLRNCATSPSHHFDVQGTDLRDAFASIARKIHELRLTN